MRLLFITSNRLGDAILSTGVLNYFLAKHPGAALTVISGKVPAPIFRAAPGLERIIPVEKSAFAMHWLSAYADVVRQRWDIMVDLRNVGIMRLLPARTRIFGTEATGTRHRLEDYAAMLGAADVPAPKIWLDDTALAKAAQLIPEGRPVLALAPSTGPKRKLWRPDRYAAVAAALTAPDGPMPGARIAVFGAPSDAGHAGAVMDLLPSAQVLNLVGQTDPLEAAAALGRCQGFVGVDSGLMHISAAMDVPTLGLFGELGVPQAYRPWGQRTAYVHRRSPDYRSKLLPSGEIDRPAAMDGLQPTEVINAATELLRSAKSGPSPVA